MKFYYKTLAFASLLALAACSDFDEMNTNPYEPPYSPGTSNTDVVLKALILIMNCLKLI